MEKQAYWASIDLGGGCEPLAKVLGDAGPIRKFLGSKEQDSPRESAVEDISIYLWEYTQKVEASYPLKVASTLLRGSSKGAVRAY